MSGECFHYYAKCNDSIAQTSMEINFGKSDSDKIIEVRKSITNGIGFFHYFNLYLRLRTAIAITITITFVRNTISIEKKCDVFVLIQKREE